LLPDVIVIVPVPTDVVEESANPDDAMACAWAKSVTVMAYDPLMLALDAVAEITSSLDEVTVHLENMLSESLSAKEYACDRGAVVLPKSNVLSLSDSADSFVFRL
jgi:hypothetical protein